MRTCRYCDSVYIYDVFVLCPNCGAKLPAPYSPASPWEEGLYQAADAAGATAEDLVNLSEVLDRRRGGLIITEAEVEVALNMVLMKRKIDELATRIAQPGMSVADGICALNRLKLVYGTD